MKKNITINLYGTLYAIDEDACQLLEQYLDNMRNYFSQRDGGEEIADDIEHRVAELLSELRAAGHQAVSIEHVQDIIHRIGNPEQMDAEAQPTDETSEQTPPPYGGASSGAAGGAEPSADRDGARGKSWFAGRKLYRDPQDQLLGGVMSGVCQYFGGTDPLPWRILMVILALFSFSTIGIIYLVAWAIIPAARTAEERLQMRGTPVNPQTLNDELMRAARAASDAVSSPAVQQRARSLGGTLVRIVLFCCKVIAIFLLGCVIVGLFCVVCVTVAGCFESLHPEGLEYDSLGSLISYNHAIGWTSLLALLSTMVALSIPFVLLVRSLLKSPEQTQPLSTRTRATLLLAFVLCMVCSIVTTAFTAIAVRSAKNVLWERTHIQSDDKEDDEDMVDYAISDSVADEDPTVDSVNAARAAAQAAATADSLAKQKPVSAVKEAKEKAKSAVKDAKKAARKAVKDAKKAAEKAAKVEIATEAPAATGVAESK